MARIESAVLRLFALTRASTVVLLRSAIASSVSPDRTVYVRPLAAGVAVPAAEATPTDVPDATGDEKAVCPAGVDVAAGVAADRVPLDEEVA